MEGTELHGGDTGCLREVRRIALEGERRTGQEEERIGQEVVHRIGREGGRHTAREGGRRRAVGSAGERHKGQAGGRIARGEGAAVDGIHGLAEAGEVRNRHIVGSGEDIGWEGVDRSGLGLEEEEADSTGLAVGYSLVEGALEKHSR